MHIASKLAVVSLAVATLHCASVAPAIADPKRPPATAKANHPLLVIDVSDRGSNRATQNIRLSMPIAPTGGAKIETRAGNAEYEVTVVQHGPREQPGPLSIKLRRSDMRRNLGPDEPKSDLRLDVTLELRRGQRAMVARMERPDGSKTEISASLL